MSDVVIIGGGLIGMLTALELSEAGASVQIFERGTMGGESSWAGGGILSPLYPWRYSDAVNQLAKYGQRVYPQIAETIHQQSGIDPEYITSGLMVLDQHEHPQALDWAQQWQMNLQIVDKPVQYEVNLSKRYSQAIRMPDIAQMRNPRLMKSLKGALAFRDIAYKEQAEVAGLLMDQGQIKGVKVSAGNFFADKVIVAGGAWSAKIMQAISVEPKIEPVKGQMIVFRARPDTLKHIVLSAGRYLIPRKDGRIVVGSTLEQTQFDKSTSSEALDDLRQAAIEILPVLRTSVIEKQWAGLRPGSPNGVPYICPHPGIKGLFINAGHFRNGVILGAASAHLMAAMVLGKTLDMDVSPYSFEAEH